jgi:orotate phosphoribosyltransferase
MTETTASKARLVELIKELAVVHGKVTLSSGIEADYYVDLKTATLHHEAAPLIGQVMLDLLDDAGIKDFDALAG